MADLINIFVTYKKTRRGISSPKGEDIQGFFPLFLKAFSDVLPREVELSDFRFQKYDEGLETYVDLQSEEILKNGMELRATLVGQSPTKFHPVQPNTIYRLWSPVSKVNDGLVVRNSSTDIVTCSGSFTSGRDTLMETIDQTRGTTTFFALVFKDDANKNLALAGNGKGKPITAVGIPLALQTPDNSIFEPDYFWSYTMFKQRNSDYYLGCDAKGNLTLVENWNPKYPNPQALFILNKPDKSV